MNRTQIKAKVRRVVAKANKIWGIDMKNPKVTFFCNSRDAGWAICDEHILGFNQEIAEINGIDFDPIVIHEVAHLVAVKLYPSAKKHHGREFMAVDLMLGGGGFSHHNLVIPSDLIEQR